MLHMCVHVCVHVQSMCGCVYGGQRSMQGFFSVTLYHYFHKVSLTELGAHRFGWTGCPATPRTLPVSAFSTLRLQEHACAGSPPFPTVCARVTLHASKPSVLPIPLFEGSSVKGYCCCLISSLPLPAGDYFIPPH